MSRELEDRAVERLLVFRVGQLGDLLVALPAMWSLRERFPNASITLLGSVVSARAVSAHELFEGSGVVDHVVTYPPGWGPARVARLLRLWRGRFQAAAYLAPRHRSARQLRRDRRILRMLGVRRFLGLERAKAPHPGDWSEARRLFESVSLGAFDGARCDLGLSLDERAHARELLANDTPARVRVAVGPGAAMPSKVWPEERFAATLRGLADVHDAEPLVFGGPEDRELGERLVRALGRGRNFAGETSPRTSAALMEHCALYLGNDTGTMHLAASGGLPCVAVFSMRETPEHWAPIGAGHAILTADVDCRSCGLVECLDNENACTRAIEVRDVFQACGRILEGRMSCAS